jgi:hypothetical protein
MSVHADYPLLAEVERFIGAAKMPPTKFGALAAADPRLVFDMRNGRELRRKTEKRLREFMRNYSVDPVSPSCEAS